MANSATAMEEQERKNLEETIEALELELDSKEDKIDELNSEVLELQKEINAFRRGAKMPDERHIELLHFKSSLLRIIRNLDGLTEKDFLYRAHSFICSLRGNLEAERDVINYEKYGYEKYAFHMLRNEANAFTVDFDVVERKMISKQIKSFKNTF